VSRARSRGRAGDIAASYPLLLFEVEGRPEKGLLPSGLQFLVGDTVTVADFVTAYTLDIAAVLEKHRLLDDLPRLRGFMERRPVRGAPLA
jgi:glutathione S-transferase